MQIAALMTCHNRKEKTTACLRALFRASTDVPEAQFQVFVTDDGSTDGTAKAIEQLGEKTMILNGTGNLFWNRGMVRAWEVAASTTNEFDAYLLLNDDTLIDPDGLQRMLGVSSDFFHCAIVVGAIRDPDTGAQTYGGVRRTSQWHPGRMATVPVATFVQEADTFNANCVLVPKHVFERIGTLDPIFHHGMGDFDYGLRAKAAALRIVVAPGTVGTCSRNSVAGTWQDSDVNLARRLRLLNSPKGLPRREWESYLRRHGAIIPGLLAWLPTARVIWSSAIRAIQRRPSVAQAEDAR